MLREMTARFWDVYGYYLGQQFVTPTLLGSAMLMEPHRSQQHEGLQHSDEQYYDCNKFEQLPKLILHWCQFVSY